MAEKKTYVHTGMFSQGLAEEAGELPAFKGRRGGCRGERTPCQPNLQMF